MRINLLRAARLLLLGVLGASTMTTCLAVPNTNASPSGGWSGWNEDVLQDNPVDLPTNFEVVYAGGLSGARDTIHPVGWTYEGATYTNGETTFVFRGPGIPFGDEPHFGLSGAGTPKKHYWTYDALPPVELPTSTLGVIPRWNSACHIDATISITNLGLAPISLSDLGYQLFSNAPLLGQLSFTNMPPGSFTFAGISNGTQLASGQSVTFQVTNITPGYHVVVYQSARFASANDYTGALRTWADVNVNEAATIINTNSGPSGGWTGWNEDVLQDSSGDLPTNFEVVFAGDISGQRATIHPEGWTYEGASYTNGETTFVFRGPGIPYGEEPHFGIYGMGTPKKRYWTYDALPPLVLPGSTLGVIPRWNSFSHIDATISVTNLGLVPISISELGYMVFPTALSLGQLSMTTLPPGSFTIAGISNGTQLASGQSVTFEIPDVSPGYHVVVFHSARFAEANDYAGTLRTWADVNLDQTPSVNASMVPTGGGNAWNEDVMQDNPTNLPTNFEVVFAGQISGNKTTIYPSDWTYEGANYANGETTFVFRGPGVPYGNEPHFGVSGAGIPKTRYWTYDALPPVVLPGSTIGVIPHWDDYQIVATLSLTNLGSEPISISDVRYLVLSSAPSLAQLNITNMPPGTLTFAGITNGTQLVSGQAVTFDVPNVNPGYHVVVYHTASFAGSNAYTGTVKTWVDVKLAQAPPVPRLSISRAGANIIISGTNGAPGAPYHLITSTSIGLPVYQWATISTNVFDQQGRFTFTNAFNPVVPQRFYLLRLP